jgi:hypothetical protein
VRRITALLVTFTLAAPEMVTVGATLLTVTVTAVVPAAGADIATLSETVTERVRSALRFNADVEAVGSLEADAPVLVDTRTWE